jgi:hypothetical protein
MEFPVRIVPVVALYAGRPDMLERVADVVRVTQDCPAPVAVGQAYARILEAAILSGTSGNDAISAACTDVEQPKRRRQETGMESKVIKTMRDVMDISHLPLSEAVLSLGGGRFCTSQVA